MKKTILLFLVIGFISCTNDDFELNNNFENSDFSNLNVQACDCGIDDLRGGGSNGGNGSSDDHIFESYDYFGDVTISGYNNDAFQIYNKSLLKFSYGINLNGNGEITQSTIGNIVAKSGVTVLRYDHNNDFYTFFLRVKGERWALVDKQWKKVTVYTNVNLNLPTPNLPSFSGGGSGGSGVFPYNQ